MIEEIKKISGIKNNKSFKNSIYYLQIIQKGL